MRLMSSRLGYWLIYRFFDISFVLVVLVLPLVPQEGENITQGIDTSSFETVTADSQTKSLSRAQAFLDMGYQFLQQKNTQKAREYLQKSAALEDGDTSKKAQMVLINLRAASGEKELLSEMEYLDEKDKPQGYFMMTDGWESHYFENPGKRDYLDLAKEYYSFLVARYPDSLWIQKARLKLSSLYLDEEKYGLALDNLLPFLESSRIMERSTPEAETDPYPGVDMAWFLLGRILEESNQYKDHERALSSYTKVLGFLNSPFSEIAEKRIRHLKKTF